eukprot:c14077_g1_i1.p1 GENE.c14077_g1_i1~~c14077_g1_i1.p1  ORF type:complete len:343 (+),score=71.70 c14077_g1_i1:1081-2109(+)
MAIQMLSCVPVVGHTTPDLLPDMDWLRIHVSDLRMVVLCNPGNPSGTIIPESILNVASELCRSARTWLVVDNTYEYFVYPGTPAPTVSSFSPISSPPPNPSHVHHGNGNQLAGQDPNPLSPTNQSTLSQSSLEPAESVHYCCEGNHVINLFSFSKAYGMMGWRVGYIAYPFAHPNLAAQLLKVQDTIPICASALSQRVALGALRSGRDWVMKHVNQLALQRELILDAVSVLGPDSVVGRKNGAIYFMVKLPRVVPSGEAAQASKNDMDSDGDEIDEMPDDGAFVKWLANAHGVCVIPGHACGFPGYFRVSYANLPVDRYAQAAQRLKTALQQVVSNPSIYTA